MEIPSNPLGIVGCRYQAPESRTKSEVGTHFDSSAET